MSVVVAMAREPSRRAFLPVLREIGDLKRITSAGRPGSIAERAFRRAWSELAAGRNAGDVALETTARCLAATRLGDLDIDALVALDVPGDDAAEIVRDAIGDAASSLPITLKQRLGGPSSPDAGPTDPVPGGGPSFVDALARQPRAGATCPGRPRIVLQPAESHAEHCLVVAVYGVVLAEPGADPGRIFLAGLAHHLHNAAMPDSGFTGEMLLGPHLAPVMARATAAAMAELPSDLAAEVEAAREILPDASTPEGRAFHAADVIDRVLEIDQHLAAARITMADILGDMALVHDGPVKPFHDAVLAEMGLA